MAGEIDKLSIEIGASSVSATNSIKRVKDALNELRNVLAGENGSTAKKLKELADGLNAIKGLGTISIGDKLPDQLRNIGKAVSEVSSDTIHKLDEMTAAIERLKGIDLKSFSNAVKAAQKATGPSGLQTVTKSTGAAATEAGLVTAGNATGKEISDIISDGDKTGRANFFAKAFQSAIPYATKLRSVISSLAKSALKAAIKNAQRLGKSLSNLAKSGVSFAKNGLNLAWDRSSFKKLSDGFSRLKKTISQFGRVAFYRAVRSAIKYVTDALREGTTNAYHFAREYGNATKYIADAYDNLSSKNFTMSNQLGAAWATLIATIEPILIRIINLVTRAANAVTQLFALLGGKSSYLKAVDYNKKWADSAGGAAAAAKEWKNQLMGFDEINRLDEPSDGGGGGGGAADDYANMFEEAPISDWMKDIKDAFSNGKWQELGELLGNKFNEIVNSVKWGELGKKIGTSIKNAVTAAYSFLSTADFQNLGGKIAEFLNNMGDSIDWTKLGRLSMRLKTALWDVIYGAVTGMNWYNVAVNLSDYFIGALTEFSGWISTLDPSEVAQSIKDFFSGLSAKKEEIGAAIKEALKAAFGFATGVAGELFPETFGDDIKKTIEEKLRTIGEIVGKATMGLGALLFFSGTAPIKGLALMAAGAVVTAASQSSGNSFEEIKKSLEMNLRNIGITVGLASLALGAILTFSGVAPMKGIALMAAGAAITAVSVDWNALKQQIDSTLANIAGGLMIGGAAMSVIGMVLAMTGNFALGIGMILAGVGMFGVGAANYDWDALGNKIDEKLEEAKTNITESLSNIKDRVALKWETIKTDTAVAWGMIKKSISDKLDDAKTNASEKVDNIKRNVVDKWTQIKQSTSAWWDLVKQTISNAMGDSETDISIGIDNILGDFDVFSGGIWEKMRSIGDTIRTWVQYAIGWLSSLISQLDNLAGNPAYNMWDGGHSSLSSGGRSRKFASGGFPEDGFFYANHNELVGGFSNGRTAVANNEQITNGIANAVYGAFMSAFAQTGGSGSNNSGPIILNINGREFARATYADRQAVDREHGSRMVVNGVGA